MADETAQPQGVPVNALGGFADLSNTLAKRLPGALVTATALQAASLATLTRRKRKG